MKLPNRLLSIEDVAEFLHISTNTVKSYINDGKLKPVKNLGIRRFLPNEVASFIGTEVGALSPITFNKLQKELSLKEMEVENLKNEISFKNETIEKIEKLIVTFKREF